MLTQRKAEPAPSSVHLRQEIERAKRHAAAVTNHDDARTLAGYVAELEAGLPPGERA